jgi:hypothetical protein
MCFSPGEQTVASLDVVSVREWGGMNAALRLSFPTCGHSGVSGHRADPPPWWTICRVAAFGSWEQDDHPFAAGRRSRATRCILHLNR